MDLRAGDWKHTRSKSKFVNTVNLCRKKTKKNCKTAHIKAMKDYDNTNRSLTFLFILSWHKLKRMTKCFVFLHKWFSSLSVQ